MKAIQIEKPGRYNRFDWNVDKEKQIRIGFVLNTDLIKAFRKKAKSDGYLMSDKVRELMHKYIKGEI
jgi:hypothetical protein